MIRYGVLLRFRYIPRKRKRNNLILCPVRYINQK